MKAIVTKYYGPTNSKGSRISADDGDGNGMGGSSMTRKKQRHLLAALRRWAKRFR